MRPESQDSVMNHTHMHSFTSIQAQDEQILTDLQALNSLLDSMLAQELALGRSVDWTGNIQEPQEDFNGTWVVYTRALALTGYGSDATPCTDHQDTILCEEFKQIGR